MSQAYTGRIDPKLHWRDERDLASRIGNYEALAAVAHQVLVHLLPHITPSMTFLARLSNYSPGPAQKEIRITPENLGGLRDPDKRVVLRSALSLYGLRTYALEQLSHDEKSTAASPDESEAALVGRELLRVGFSRPRFRLLNVPATRELDKIGGSLKWLAESLQLGELGLPDTKAMLKWLDRFFRYIGDLLEQHVVRKEKPRVFLPFLRVWKHWHRSRPLTLASGAQPLASILLLGSILALSHCPADGGAGATTRVDPPVQSGQETAPDPRQARRSYEGSVDAIARSDGQSGGASADGSILPEHTAISADFREMIPNNGLTLLVKSERAQPSTSKSIWGSGYLAFKSQSDCESSVAARNHWTECQPISPVLDAWIPLDESNEAQCDCPLEWQPANNPVGDPAIIGQLHCTIYSPTSYILLTEPSRAPRVRLALGDTMVEANAWPDKQVPTTGGTLSPAGRHDWSFYFSVPEGPVKRYFPAHDLQVTYDITIQGGDATVQRFSGGLTCAHLRMEPAASYR